VQLVIGRPQDCISCFIQANWQVVSFHCFDRETEILTPFGWKNWKTLQVGDVAYGIEVTSFEPGRRPLRWGRVPVIPNPVIAVDRRVNPENTRALSDELQEMLALCGFRSTISVHKIVDDKEQLCVSFSNPATTDVTRSSCVGPGPTVNTWRPLTALGTVIARRNGRTFIS
jgi:hypothetical protein